MALNKSPPLNCEGPLYRCPTTKKRDKNLLCQNLKYGQPKKTIFINFIYSYTLRQYLSDLILCFFYQKKNQGHKENVSKKIKTSTFDHS